MDDRLVEFRRRREALHAAHPDAVVLVRGALEEEGAPTYRQNGAFDYLTGVETPGAYLMMLPEGLPPALLRRDLPDNLREILFLPARSPAAETWTGPKLGFGEEAEKQTGFEKTLDVSALWALLAAALRQAPAVATIAPFGEGAALTRDYALIRRIQELAPIAQFRDLTPALASLRAVKSPYEIACIEEAISVTVEGQRAARALIASAAGRREYEAEARIFEAFRSRGAHLAFPSIVGAGINGTVLHYEANRDVMQAGELVVVDIGARVGVYCGDITRTYPVGGRFTDRQREIYQLVLDAHQHAVASFQFGKDSLLALTARCKRFFEEAPLRARDADGEEKTMEAFFPHGLSHHLGIDVHDLGARDTPLAAGSVITIEPGLYIPAERIGVRLEDDYLVTEMRLQRLGPPLEVEVRDVEAAMARER